MIMGHPPIDLKTSVPLGREGGRTVLSLHTHGKGTLTMTTVAARLQLFPGANFTVPSW